MEEHDALGGWGITVALGSGVLALIYIYNSWWFRRMRKEGLPGPRGLPILGSIPHVIRNGIMESEDGWMKQYGDVFGWVSGQQVNVVVKDPALLKEVLVKDFSHFTDRGPNISGHPVMSKHVFAAEGKAWKRIRAILSPTFSTGKMKLMNEDINRCSKMLAAKLKEAANAKKVIDPKEYFGAFTMDVISATAFSLDVDSQTNKDDPFVKNARGLFVPRKSFLYIISLATLFPPLRHLFSWLQMGFFSGNVVDFFVRTVNMMVQDRRQNPNIRRDFLQLMMNAELENTAENSDLISVNKKLSTDEIIASSVLFFVAGYETTASLLQYSAYELAVNPDIHERMLQEIQDTIGDEEPVYENIRQLTYMDQVLYEVLRKYPPVNRLTRSASEDRVIDGVTLRKGFRVVIPIYNIHHDPRFYPEPEVFNPERFADRSAQNSVQFLSFGFGPRICLGLRLAMMETKIAMVHLLRNVKFITCTETQIPLELSKRPGLTQPKKTISLMVESRN
ncbi:cytochrome P450 3A9-like [Ylistrum balloti]|uniref:cytochrome P450 3A9-like n=1 Tax=Ylistrum balloti TaxID=509963 RepID=UPI002905D96E|nr:cytochrome P450 3A9-like [Ylistrum balloti]